MLLIRCPYCGDRPELEFRHCGEAHVARPADPAAASNAAWTEFLYLRGNPRGVVAERWRHLHGCGRFFNALRHTVTERFLATYPAGTPRPETPA